MHQGIGRRAALVTVAGVLAGPVLAQSGTAARMIVPYTPGGTSDWLARLIAQKLNDRWGASIVVENRPGGDTQIGTLAVVRAKPDGQTLLFSSVSMGTVNKYTAPTIGYDAERDLIPAALVARGPALLLANPALGISTFAEFVAHAKNNGDRLSFSTASSTGLLYGEIFKQAIGIKALAVPYNGSAPAALAVATGEVDFTWESIPSAKPLVDGGRVKVLVTTSQQRLDQLRDVPTARELGYPQLEPIGGWWGIFLPAGTPPDVVNRLNASVNEIIAAEGVRKEFQLRGVFASPMTPTEFTRFMAAEYERHLAAAKQLKS